MFLSASFGVTGLTNVGYAFYTAGNTLVGPPVTTGIVNAGNGFFSADATVPGTATQVQWTATFTFPDNTIKQLYAREDLTVQLNAVYLASELQKIPKEGSTQVYLNIDTEKSARVQISADV